MEIEVDKKYKKFIRSSWLFLALGFFLLAIGGFKFLYLEPQIAINLKTQHQVVKNGTVELVLGVGFFAIGLYRVLNSERIFKNIVDLDMKNDKTEGKEKRKIIRGYRWRNK